MSEAYGIDVDRRSIRFVCFWLAVWFPVLYAPLFVRGLDTPTELAAFFLLVAVNLAVLVIGHSHQPT